MWRVWCFLIPLFFLEAPRLCNGGTTSSYVRKGEPAEELSVESFPPPQGYNAPEQVHITQGDHEGRGVIISWVTPEEKQPNWIRYWKASSQDKEAATPVKRRRSFAYSSSVYKFYTYTSGYIHHAVITDLEFNTTYKYEVGNGNVNRQFSFTTPPEPGPDVPYTFGIIGDLGQTKASNQTLEHYLANPKGQAMLFIGDLSYADNHPNHNNVKWDTWGRFIEKSAAYQPWIWTAGNHELDYAPDLGEPVPFKPFTERFHVPYTESQSTSPLWYSIKRASAYIIVLSSYSAYGKYTPQYSWLEQELPKVNRSETPWLFVLVHCPWYNSNNYHYMEGDTMRVQFEHWFVKYKVDIVFSGHVHSYERSERVSNIAYNITNGKSYPVRDLSAPMYITIGDGGNIEGIADNFSMPQPDYSAYREASFGHAVLEIKNRSHAYYTWHRNQDDAAVAGDATWIYNRYWLPLDESRHR